MFSASSPSHWAVLQLPCCPSKQRELSEHILQNLFLNLPPQTVLSFEKTFRMVGSGLEENMNRFPAVVELLKSPTRLREWQRGRTIATADPLTCIGLWRRPPGSSRRPPPGPAPCRAPSIEVNRIMFRFGFVRNRIGFRHDTVSVFRPK